MSSQVSSSTATTSDMSGSAPLVEIDIANDTDESMGVTSRYFEPELSTYNEFANCIALFSKEDVDRIDVIRCLALMKAGLAVARMKTMDLMKIHRAVYKNFRENIYLSRRLKNNNERYLAIFATKKEAMKGSDGIPHNGKSLWNLYRNNKKDLLNNYAPHWKEPGEWPSGWNEDDLFDDIRRIVWVNTTKLKIAKHMRKQDKNNKELLWGKERVSEDSNAESDEVGSTTNATGTSSITNLSKSLSAYAERPPEKKDCPDSFHPLVLYAFMDSAIREDPNMICHTSSLKQNVSTFKKTVPSRSQQKAIATKTRKRASDDKMETLLEYKKDRRVNDQARLDLLKKSIAIKEEAMKHSRDAKNVENSISALKVLADMGCCEAVSKLRSIANIEEM